MTGIKCLDTSAWLAYYFAESPVVKEIVEGKELIITSSLSLFEIKKKLISLQKDFQELLKFIKARGEVIAPAVEIAEKAADFATTNRLGAMDALIYATSILRHADLVTGDNDFRGLPSVRIV